MQSTGLRESVPPAAVTYAKRRARSKLEHLFAQHLALMGLEPAREHRFHSTRRWRFDFAFPEVFLAIELNGAIFTEAKAEFAEQGGKLVAVPTLKAGRHSRGAGQLNDMEKLNAAIELGWSVLVYGPPHVRSGAAAIQTERIVLRRRAALVE